MTPETVAPGGLRLAGVSGLGIHDGDHPIRRHPPRDAPPPVGAVGGLHILPRHQRQQPQRVRRRLLPVRRVLATQLAQHLQRVGDQIRHQVRLGVRIVPIDVWLARFRVVAPGHPLDHRFRAGHQPRHLPHRRHQLGHRVLGSHRVVEHRRIHAPFPTAAQDPGLRDDPRPRRTPGPDDPTRRCACANTPAWTGRTTPASATARTPPSSGCRSAPRPRSAVGQVEQLLEHQHRPDQIRRQRRPRGGAEQIRAPTFPSRAAPVLGNSGEKFSQAAVTRAQ
jgi:hypothetical protein